MIKVSELSFSVGNRIFVKEEQRSGTVQRVWEDGGIDILLDGRGKDGLEGGICYPGHCEIGDNDLSLIESVEESNIQSQKEETLSERFQKAMGAINRRNKQ